MRCFLLRNDFNWGFTFDGHFVKLLCFTLLVVGLFRSVLSLAVSDNGFREFFTDDGGVSCSPHEHNRTCCYADEFQCGDGTCVPLSKVCEMDKFNKYADFWGGSAKVDCNDASDEMGCKGVPCVDRSHECDQTCLDLPGSNKSRCSCYKGFQLDLVSASDNKFVCEDIDECEIAVHLCNHHCINLNGSFTCGCRNGLLTGGEKNTSCIAEDDIISLFYTSDDYIFMYNIESGASEEVVYTGRVVGMDFDPIAEMLYWSTENGVWRTYIPGAKQGNVSVAHSQSLHYTFVGANYIRSSMAIDWRLGNMYWLSPHELDDTLSMIFVSKLDGRYVKTVHPVLKTEGLVLDLNRGVFIWISNRVENVSVIYSSWMIASGKSWKLVKIHYGNVSVITFDDLSNDRIYWADIFTNTIYYVFSDGKRSTKVIQVDSNRFPVSMDVLDDFLYWVTIRSGELIRTNKFGKGRIEVLVQNLINPHIVKVYHKNKFQDFLVQKESLLCGKCSHICFSTEWITKCDCPDGVKASVFKGSAFCESESETPMEDPLACDCNDLDNVCNKSSSYASCSCDTCTIKASGGLSSFILSLDEMFSSKGKYFAILIVGILLCFIFSFLRKNNNST